MHEYDQRNLLLDGYRGERIPSLMTLHDEPHGVKLSALNLAYRGGRLALRDLDLELRGPGIAAIVGANGAGKSSLLRVVAGYEHPTSGSVKVDGRNVGGGHPTRWLAYVGPSSPLFSGLSSVEHVRFAGALQDDFDGGAALARLHRYGVPMDQPASRLSSGERMQVSIALAMSKGARVLLFDEPLAPLDPLARQMFVSELEAFVSKTGALALVSSHDIADVGQLSTWLVLLSHGSIVASVSVAQVLTMSATAGGPGPASEHWLAGGPAAGSAIGARGELIREFVLDHMRAARNEA